MQQYRVIGAERETGTPVDFEVEANDPAHAERIANSRGVLVRGVTPLTSSLEPVREKPRRARNRGLLIGGTMTLAGFFVVVMIFAVRPPSETADDRSAPPPTASIAADTAERHPPSLAPVSPWRVLREDEYITTNVQFRAAIAKRDLKPGNTVVGMLVSVQNWGESDERVSFRVKAVDETGDVIWFSELEMTWTGVAKAGQERSVFAPTYTIPAGIDERYFATKIEFKVEQ